MLSKHLLFSFLFFHLIASAQKPANSDKFAHTFSIVAQDPVTGDMAVGVQSHWFSVGTSVPWGKSGVGVVATQSFVNERYGYAGLQLMEQGLSAEQALERLKEEDEGLAFRQVAMLSKDGSIAAFTGEKCVEAALHLVEDNYSIQANMMEDEDVVYAMRDAFEENSNLQLAERVIAAMKAAQASGGDIRGKQSSALIVVGKDAPEQPWLDKKIDLRVDDHRAPIEELSRLLNIHRAYEFMTAGDVAMENKNPKAALEAYEKAETLLSTNEEIKFWKAVALVNSDQVNKSIPIFERLFMNDKRWQRLLGRLPASELISIDKSALDYLLNL
ncbi:DUF1028 domain-containing protein [Psychroflexus sediminis]|uniref:Uncharacterized conserved protein, Ntn-hydrolase superfamily n=1 Tax=Psychroflexus sediminis TaxID=470826 RepID=A0A1G7TUX2_9FLAO|nr:DUF1028 domain-containing protein [Psychroflexus sediminis]SDG39062.1 Uncharacterized conserved protein, Ntn-hydrolase superfamily [Psychroflexus sediminis]